MAAIKVLNEIQDNNNNALQDVTPKPGETNVLVRAITAAGTQEDITVPTGARFVFLSSDGNFSCGFDQDSAYPAADVTDGTGVIVNPTGLWSVEGVVTLHVDSDTTGIIVTAAFWS